MRNGRNLAILLLGPCFAQLACGSGTATGALNDGAYRLCDGGCEPDATCAYAIAEGCAASGVCVPLGPLTGACKQPTYCGCSSAGVGQSCRLPSGFSPAPVQGTFFPCASAADSGVAPGDR
jgi:hypothetical protein